MRSSRKVRTNWRNLHEQRNFFDSLAKKLNFNSLNDFYQISQSTIFSFGGKGLLGNLYCGSPAKALVSVYPEHDWKLWNFKVAHKTFWSEPYNRRSFFDWLGRQLGFVSYACWYRISRSDVNRHGGSGLLQLYYRDSVFNALKDIYSEYPWLFWRFSKAPNNFWSDLENHKVFLDYLGNQLGFLYYEDFYRLSLRDILSYGGRGLVAKYKSSIYRCLRTIFPEFNWCARKFSRIPRRSVAPRGLDFSVFSIVRADNLSDWYRVPMATVRKFGIKNTRELIQALKTRYPEFDWNTKQFQKSRKKIFQWKLKRLFEEILEKMSIQRCVLEDYWELQGVVDSSIRSMELDIFVPSLNLAFEYQGVQHFRDHHYFGRNVDYRLRDYQKRFTCKRFGITLISVPYNLWLDEKSVAKLVHRFRPDIIN